MTQRLGVDEKSGLGFFRLRIGDYRVIFSVLAEEITISRVGHRSEVYR